jgi:regulator of protease activity HflC (stomatin/prohibitin superfamily)
VTRDNVMIHLDGVLYFRIKDSLKAAYGARDPVWFTKQLATSIMRSEIGKLTLDETFEERERVNHNIMAAIQAATEEWGVECTRYEIKDIILPDGIKSIMNRQAEAERNKRSAIIESEGIRTAKINAATANQRSMTLTAEGEGEAMFLEAKALAERLTLLHSLYLEKGPASFRFRAALLYLRALNSLENKEYILRKGVEDPSRMVRESLELLKGQ